MCYTVGRKGADGVGDRIILHCDLNCFYASVELLEHPELRGAPAAVCGDPRQRHGVILAKNEAAKAAGVRTGESVWQASQRCPGLHLLPAHHEKYRHYSRLVNEVYQSYTDRVERFGIDESWLDVTGTLHLFGGDAEELADAIRARVRETFGLTLSVGVSFNKVFAKLGSDYRKPDATTCIPPAAVPGLVWPLPADRLLGVGPAAAQVLARCGVRTIGELAHAPRDTLRLMLGRQGPQLQDWALGLDRSPVALAGTAEPPKSVGNGLTFPRDLMGEDELRTGFTLLADQVAGRLRRYGLKGTTVQVAIRDPQFRTIQHQRRLDAPTFLSSELVRAAMALTGERWNWRLPVRALTLTVSGLLPQDQAGEQLDLFSPGDSGRRDRRERLERAVDGIRAKYGDGAIAPSSLLGGRKPGSGE